MRLSLFLLLLFSSFAWPQEKPAEDYIRKLAREAPLALQFKGNTAQECRRWQEEFAGQLRKSLGPHTPPGKWHTEVEKTVELGDHRRIEMVLKADDHPPLPLYLLLPSEKSSKRRPAILAIHGHGSFGYDPVAGLDDDDAVDRAIRSANYDYGRQLVRLGYVVAVPCLTPFGRRLEPKGGTGKQDACAVTFVRLQLLGKVLIAENLRDCLWAIEFLARRDDVDADRLGCVGLSYGGRMTTLTAALEPRIKVAVISGALNVFQERVGGAYSCGAQVIPGLLQYGDVPEICSLIAPRPCLFEVGKKDGLISPTWAEKALGRIHHAYHALGAGAQLHFDRFDGGHRWNGRVAYPLLEKVLRPAM